LVRIGLHSSVAGSFEQAAIYVNVLGAKTFQIFSSSPRMWRGVMPRPDEIAKLKAARAAFDLAPLVIHANYLINLPAADPSVRKNSIKAFRGEIDRAIALGAEYLVLHPGSYREQTPESAIEAFADSLAAAADGVVTPWLTILLENTAGAGSALGSRLEELATLRDLAAPKIALPIGYCLDTCHLLAAGYDIATADGLGQAMADADRVLGLDNVPVIHTNDSKGAFGSHLDRHANIGEGHIGRDAFRRILHHPRLQNKAFILETPMDDGGDRRDMEALFDLSQ
jgi:deoxyribonuclease IV